MTSLLSFKLVATVIKKYNRKQVPSTSIRYLYVGIVYARTDMLIIPDVILSSEWIKIAIGELRNGG